MIKSRRMGWARHVARMGEKNAYKVLVRKLEGNKQLEIHRRKWEDNNRMCLKEIRWGGMDWINLAQGRDQWRALVNMTMNLRVP
jgi:hypothetical protein